MNESDAKAKNKQESFVNYIIQRCTASKGTAAALRRADNLNTEYQSWEYLAPFVDLETPWEREPYALIAASIAKAKIDGNGSSGIGNAIARCYAEGNTSDQAKAKLRRLLACDSAEEACRVLRPLLSLIVSKTSLGIDYVRLLQQLLRLYWQPDQVKAQWAQDFYSKSTSTEGGGQ